MVWLPLVRLARLVTARVRFGHLVVDEPSHVVGRRALVESSVGGVLGLNSILPECLVCNLGCGSLLP